MGSDSTKESTERSLRELPAETIGDLVALLTHDLRNPLAALASNVGYLTMVGSGLTADVREAIFDLQLSVEVMSRIAESMDLVSKELGGHEQPVPGRYLSSALIRALTPAVERAATSHGVTLRVDMGLEAEILVAEPAFTRALSGLLHNAVSLAPTGSEIRLLVSELDQQLIFRVEDSGAELDPVLSDVAFSAAGQVEVKGRLSGRYSRGLGLFVVKCSADTAGAQVRVAESLQGSAIELVAPLAR